MLICFDTGGPRGALGGAVACGILLGVFEGVGVLFGRIFSEGARPVAPRKLFDIPGGISLLLTFPFCQLHRNLLAS